jgi:hypothetical protein
VETTVDCNSKTKGVFSDEINNPFVAAKIWLPLDTGDVTSAQSTELSSTSPSEEHVIGG